MRKAGADYFYDQQKKLKRIYDLVNDNKLIQFSKEEIDKVWPLAKELVHKACIRAGGIYK